MEKLLQLNRKLENLKKILFRSKKLHKANRSSGGKKRFDSKKTIKKAADNMNKTNSEKYGLPPETIEKRTLSDDVFREVYDFHRIVKVSKDADRYKRYELRQDKKFKRKLREPLLVGEKVLVLAERLKKKDAPGLLFKSTTENIPFFNRKETFIVRRVLPLDGNFYYWLSKSGEDKTVEKRFLRQELFALKNQFTNNSCNGTYFYVLEQNKI